MKEIEVKIRTTKSQEKLINNWLKKNAKFEGEKQQTEYYLNNPQASFMDKHKLGYLDTAKYLRVRMTPQGDSVCIKIFKRDPNTIASENLAEYESPVENGETALKIFEAAGYTEKTRVAKIRKAYLYKNFEIVVDQVEKLGSFVEIELKKHHDDTEKGMRAIFDLFRLIGFTEIDEQERGYVSMLWNPKYNFGKTISLR